MTPEMLEHLNEQQREAVIAQGAPVLVLAGAGSGKTRVITRKIAYAVGELYQDPASILAVTFTNKAANEMRERLASMIHPQQANRVVIRTFHSFGAWVLRSHAEVLGLNPNFTIYDDDDSLTLLHGLYPEYKRKDLAPYMKAVSRAKDQGLAPGDDLDEVTHDTRVSEMYRRYQARLEDIGNVDFGDLIARVIELFRKDPGTRKLYQQRFRTVLVDEYQDTNTAQFELLRLLYSPDTHLCVVGDDDQSIYAFRGAEVKNILRFPELFPGTRIIKLEQNYRSTGRILAIASEVVKNNSGRHEKTLWSERPPGKRARLAFVHDHTAEAEYCASLIRSWGTGEGAAVLYRTNAQSAAFETVFLREKIPYKIIGALRFFEREEVKDAMALLALLVNPADEVAFKRMVNKPARGIGRTSLDKIFSTGARDMIDACRTSAADLRGRAKEGAEAFVKWHEESLASLEHGDLPVWVTDVLERSGLVRYHRKQDEISATQKESNLEELVNASASYPPGMEGLREFLEALELDRSRLGSDDPSERDGITLITMHNTKGLEFPKVIITGLEEGLFPGRPRGDEDNLEEERRIFYVSITRAMDELYLTSCRRRFLWGQSTTQMPSRFLRELPQEHVEIIGGGKTDMARPSFRNGPPSFGRSIPPPQKAADDENPCRFSTGDRVYHEAYGNGYITSAWREDGREVVTVQFETGMKARFLPDYSPLEKVAHD